jgi:hypothetical protein
MDLGAVKEQIRTTQGLGQIRSMGMLKMTANNNLEEHHSWDWDCSSPKACLHIIKAMLSW